MQFLILRAEAEEEEEKATGQAGRQWLVEYSVLSTRYSQPSARVLAVREGTSGRQRDKFCNKRRFDGQHIRLLMLPINAGRVIAKLP